MILLAKRLGKMPSEILNEDVVWIDRLAEVEYLAGMQGVNL